MKPSIRVLRKVFSKQRRYSRLSFVENTIGNLPNVPRAKFPSSSGLFCFISICKFVSFNNPFATIISLFGLYYRIRRFTLLIQTKKMISMNYGRSTGSWKLRIWVKLDLIFSMRDIYINSNLNPLTKFTNSSKSTKLKDILSWSITIPIYWNNHQLCDEMGHPIVDLMESQWKLRQQHENFLVEGKSL